LPMQKFFIAISLLNLGLLCWLVVDRGTPGPTTPLPGRYTYSYNSANNETTIFDTVKGEVTSLSTFNGQRMVMRRSTNGVIQVDVEKLEATDAAREVMAKQQK